MISRNLVVIILLLTMVSVVFASPLLSELYKINIKETIKLCYKKAPDWTCIKTGQPSGFVIYSVVDDKLELTVIGIRLDSNYRYQLTLNGDGTNNHGVDDILAGMSNDRYVSGCWNGSSYAPPCNGYEGFYNFEMAASLRGHVLYNKYSVDLPEGIYEGVKFIVKRTTGEDGKGGDFKPVLMETEQLNFVIVKP